MTTPPALKVKRVKIDTLTLDPDNVREHDPRNITSIRESLERFGQRKNVVVDADGKVIAGNGTVVAAQELGWTEITVAPIPDGWTEEDVRAFAIADNRTAELAHWNNPELLAQLTGLDGAVPGFDETDIADLQALWGDPEPFDDIGGDFGPVPESDEVTVSMSLPRALAARWRLLLDSAPGDEADKIGEIIDIVSEAWAN